jgi:hypothetical protein
MKGESSMKDATHITLVVDRTGSMYTIQKEAEGGVNAFLDEQRNVAGDCHLYLVQFDLEAYDVVHDGPITGAGAYHLDPRSNTPLLDAVGRAITETGERLAALDEDDRPDKVIFIVQTDGEENASHDWTWESINAVVKRQTEEFNWQFVFLGTGPDTWAQGTQMGFAHTTRSAAGGQAVASTYDNTSRAVTQMRTNSTTDMAAASASVAADGTVTVDDDDG